LKDFYQVFTNIFYSNTLAQTPIKNNSSSTFDPRGCFIKEHRTGMTTKVENWPMGGHTMILV